MKNYALILAGGSGQRMQEEIPKAFIEINGKYLIEYSIEKFSEHPDIHHIILVVPKDYLSLSKDLVKSLQYAKIQQVIKGGDSRFNSSRIGVNTIQDQEAKILIHDAARPFLSHKIISDCLSKLEHFDGLNLLSPVSDTLVEIDRDRIIKNIDREKTRLVQTPQAFKLSCIKKAQQKALLEDTINITDDFNLVLKYRCGECSWVEGSRLNFKITYPVDLELARLLLH